MRIFVTRVLLRPWDLALGQTRCGSAEFQQSLGESLRGARLLDSAMSRAQHKYACDNASIIELVAGYASAIASNHHIVDGNGRAAFVVCVLFLELNCVGFTASEAEATAAMLSLAFGEANEEAFAKWLLDNIGSD